MPHKRKPLSRIELLLLTLLVGIAIAAGFVILSNRGETGRAAVQDTVLEQLARVSYEQDVNTYRAQVAGCERTVKDRIVARDESWAARRANLIVANDPTQSSATRDARRNQARTNLLAVVSREARIPRADRITRAGDRLPEFLCPQQFPYPERPESLPADVPTISTIPPLKR